MKGRPVKCPDASCDSVLFSERKKMSNTLMDGKHLDPSQVNGLTSGFDP